MRGSINILKHKKWLSLTCDRRVSKELAYLKTGVSLDYGKILRRE
jgi:hypothetical protein